eukprot:m.212714 g.212714  ORF g.212714 m.212714 type:complete len:55 (+) comp16948_c1_seq6:1301-1465(+)
MIYYGALFSCKTTTKDKEREESCSFVLFLAIGSSLSQDFAMQAISDSQNRIEKK